jgi:predicted O-methyltransferase YrrM
VLGGYVGYSAIFIAQTMRTIEKEARAWNLEPDTSMIDMIEELVEFEKWLQVQSPPRW